MIELDVDAEGWGQGGLIGTTGYPDWTKLPNFSRIGQDKVSSLIGRGNLPLSLRVTGL